MKKTSRSTRKKVLRKTKRVTRQQPKQEKSGLSLTSLISPENISLIGTLVNMGLGIANMFSPAKKREEEMKQIQLDNEKLKKEELIEKIQRQKYENSLIGTPTTTPAGSPLGGSPLNSNLSIKTSNLRYSNPSTSSLYTAETPIPNNSGFSNYQTPPVMLTAPTGEFVKGNDRMGFI